MIANSLTFAIRSVSVLQVEEVTSANSEKYTLVLIVLNISPIDLKVVMQVML